MSKQTKMALWEKRVGSWRSSGLSQRAWCLRQGISPQTFGYWCRRLSSRDAMLPVLVQRGEAAAVGRGGAGQRRVPALAIDHAWRGGVALAAGVACMLKPTGWWLAREPVDLRCGFDRLWLLARTSLGREPADGGGYIFRSRAETRIKVLCVDAHGVWLAVRRLHDGRFHWPRDGDAVWSLDAAQFETMPFRNTMRKRVIRTAHLLHGPA